MRFAGRPLGGVSLAILGCGLSASILAQGVGGIAPAPAFSGEDLAAMPGDGWYTNGGNLLNQRLGQP